MGLIEDMISEKSLKILGSNREIDRSVAAGELASRFRLNEKEAIGILKKLENRGDIKLRYGR